MDAVVPGSTAPLLSVRSVAMVYRSRDGAETTALEDVSFDVGPTEFVTIVGPSGCGKSTILKLIAGLLEPTAGEIFFDGRRIEGTHREMGLVFQQPVLLKWRTALDNVLLPIEFLHRETKRYRRDALDLLDLVGLRGFESRYPRELSGGMQQRVAIARALIYDPTVLLMDEPFGALDAMTREDMSVELLRIWEQRRKCVLFVTHSISEAVLLADRVVAMSGRPGRVAQVIRVDLPRPRAAETEFSDAFRNCASAVREVIYIGRSGVGPAAA